MTSSSLRRVRSVGVTAISQSLSAASNFVIILALGRTAGARAVGQFALVVIVYTAAIGLQRSSITDPLVARAPGSTADVGREGARAATMSVVISVTAGAVVLVAGALSPYHQLLLLAPFLPAMLLEDLCRYLSFRLGRHVIAAVMDGLWTVMSCIAYVVMRSHPGTDTAIILWGAGGALGAAVGVALIGSGWAPLGESARWWRGHLWRSSRWLALESAFFQADLQLQGFGFIAVAGPTLFGRWEVAQSLVGLSVFLNTGVQVVTVTTLAAAPNRERRAALLSSAACFSSAAIVTAGLVATSPLVVRLLYGHRLSVPIGIIAPTGAALAIGGLSSGASSLLRVRRSERVLPFARAAGMLLVTPAAIVVARTNFDAALWVLTGDSLIYMTIVVRAALRPAGGPTVPRLVAPT